MKKLFGLLCLTAASLAMQAQQTGKKNIDKLCGCFDIDFKYAETFSPNPDYKFHNREELGALELALPIESSDKKVVIQHLLVMGDSAVIKHWREDWVYEQSYLWVYQGDKKWTKQELRPEQYKGKWTQTVWEVDDAPRYQGISEWVTTDGKTFWQSTTAAPLPRREYTVRSDYNIMRRGNRLILADTGWTHEQDNDKLLAKDGAQTLIAQEKGYNIYTKVADAKCAYAKTWWGGQSAFWSQVRIAWQSVLQSGNTISLQTQVDSKFLYQYLDELDGQFNQKQVSLGEVSTKARVLIQKFARTSSDVAVKH